MNVNLRKAHWWLAPALAALVSCGGGTDGTGQTPPPASAPVTSSGAMTKGSVILNGLHFDDTKATVLDDRGRANAQLADGMVVRLRGRSDDGLTGAADRIKIENEVRGAVESVQAALDPPRFTVAGLTVFVDSATVYANVAGIGAILTGNRVEVHGLRDAAGNVRATRVEVLGAGVGADELRGAIAGLNTTNKTFTLNATVTVNYSGAALLPAGTTEAALANGVEVEVRGALSGSDFTATQVAVEDLQDAEFGGNANEKQEVEGFVTGFAGHPGTFLVNGREVRTTGATVFERGAAADLANNVRVEAEGTIDAGGVLIAAGLKFEQERLQLHGRATAVNAGLGTVVVLGQTVQANSLTRIDTLNAGGGNSNSLADLNPAGDCVEVRAFRDGTTIVAEEIKEPSGCGKDLVQANVTAKNQAASTLGFFGTLNADLSGATGQLRDANGQLVSPAVFFAAISAAGNGSAGTLVKVRGSLNGGGVLVAEEAEIQN